MGSSALATRPVSTSNAPEMPGVLIARAQKNAPER
jgi:hypothetical protein